MINLFVPTEIRPIVRTSVLTIVSLLMFAASSVADIRQLGYSFARNDGGGVVVVRVDTATGKFVGERILFESEGCTRPQKLRFDRERSQYVLTNETDKKSGPHLFLVPTEKNAAFREVALPARPDEVRVAQGVALLSCDGDWLARVDLESAAVTGKWNVAKILDPPANGPQDIRFSADHETVVVSFQKDSGKGKKKGSRIVAFRLPDMKPITDARLPRNRPDLHIKGNKKEQGPGPEIVYVDEPGNRIVVTLDLYGAVAIAKLDAFLSGNEVDWKYLSTAVDESWGNAFPDRMGTFEYEGKNVVMIANSGDDGGVVLLDPQRQQIVWRCEAPPGLETPVFIASNGKALSVCSGKRKTRGRRETEKTFIPQRGIYVFDFSVVDGQRPCFEVIPTDEFMFRLCRIGPEHKPWIVAAGGLGNPDTLMILDPRTGKFVDERPVIGALMRFEQE